MSLNGINSAAAAQQITGPSMNSNNAGAATGGGLPFGIGGGAAGGQIAQNGGGGSLIKKMLVGGVIGAGLGFGASFLSLPLIGGLAAPVVAAIGAGIGALGGAAMHFISNRKSKLAMTANEQTGGQAPVNVNTPKGKTLRPGDKGSNVRKLQNQLGKLGLFRGKSTGVFDKATVNAVKRYEVMKGVMPSGEGAPDLRAAVAQDSRLMNQYASGAV